MFEAYTLEPGEHQISARIIAEAVFVNTEDIIDVQRHHSISEYLLIHRTKRVLVLGLDHDSSGAVVGCGYSAYPDIRLNEEDYTDTSSVTSMDDIETFYHDITEWCESMKQEHPSS